MILHGDQDVTEERDYSASEMCSNPSMSESSNKRIAWFRQMIEERPDEARARFSLANELLKLGSDEEAVTHLRSYLSLTEDEGNAWGRLGEALARLGKVDEAADAYLEGIEQAITHGHPGMAEDFQAAVEALPDA